jgi:hypothetical protein
MPSVSVEFKIKHVPERERNWATTVDFSHLKDFWRIADLGFVDEYKVGRGNPGGLLCVRAEPNDPRLSAAFEILSKHGYHPCKRRIATPKAKEYEFEIRMHRKYSGEEISAAPLLTLKPTGDDIMASWCGGNDDQGWIAEGGRFHKKKLELGHFDSFEGLLLGPRLRKLLNDSDLMGLEFIPVRYDHPEKGCRELWQFGRKIEMPKCYLPRQDNDGSDFVEGISHAAYWDDAGYFPPELRFVREEVEALGPFDMARTKEKAGNNREYSRSEVIVSQRFREVLEKAKITSIDYVPVRLID